MRVTEGLLGDKDWVRCSSLGLLPGNEGLGKWEFLEFIENFFGPN